MRIVIDARWIFPEISGIGTYTLELLRQLASFDRTNEYLLLFETRTAIEAASAITQFNSAPNFRSILFPHGVFSLKSQLLLPPRLIELKTDVYHAPNFMIPIRAFPRNHAGRVRCVVTIHDVIPLIFPDHAPRSKKSRMFAVYKWIMHEVGRRADRIITVSQSSRSDIIQQLHIPAPLHENVVAIYNGVAQNYAPATRQAGKEKSILYVGRMDPYKNVTRVIEAFGLLVNRDKLFCSMTIIGPQDDRYPEARNRARELGLETHIRWLGYVPADDLRRHYQQADVLVLPSRYEGFGLPVLEAMGSGTPVICSNSSSLPEVAGDAAVLVDPDDTEAWREALFNVLSNPRLAEGLQRKGLAQARKFTWETAARETLKVYEAVHATSQTVF